MGIPLRAAELRRPTVLVGRDTRESSPWISATLAAGLRAAGADGGKRWIVPTPAVAFLTRKHGFQAGVVISASHNPWRDNGIKLFGSDGFKLPDSVELAMEEEILYHASLPTTRALAEDAAGHEHLADHAALADEYIQFLMDCVPGLIAQSDEDRGRLREWRGSRNCAGVVSQAECERRSRRDVVAYNARTDAISTTAAARCILRMWRRKWRRAALIWD